jgi:hypothetical protein
MAFPDARTIALLSTGRFGVAAFLRDTCDIWRTGSSGRAQVGTSVVCLINDYAPGTSQQMHEYNQDVLEYVLTTLPTQTLKIDDEVIHNGFSYQVYEVLEDKSPSLFRQARMRKMS